jgi:FkbM family methyltransferase
LSWPRVVAQARKVTGIPAARAVLRRPRVEWVVALFVRSTVVEESASFIARELRPRRQRATYRLRGSSSRVVIRHRTADVVTLDEVFHLRDYELPPPVARELDSLDEPSVLDLGANIGLFGLFVLDRYPRARITSIEADPDNAEVLRECVALSGAGERWQVVEAVASERDGTVSFVSGAYSLSHVAGPGEDGTPVRAVDTFEYLAKADLAKIDIEGGEWVILDDPRLAEAPVRAIVVEYHAFACPSPHPREAAVAALEAAGFEVEARGAQDYGIAWARRPGGRQTRTASSSNTGTSPTTG